MAENAPAAHVDPAALEMEMPSGEEVMAWFEAHADELAARGITVDDMGAIPPEQIAALMHQGIDALDDICSPGADGAYLEEEVDEEESEDPDTTPPPPSEDPVADKLEALANNSLEYLMINKKEGWTNDAVTKRLVPVLLSAKTLTEIVLVDLVNDNVVIALCDAIRQNPTILSFGIVVTEHGRPGFFTQLGIEHIAAMVATTPLRNLFLNNCLQNLLPDCTEILAQSLYVSSTLSRLDLSRNSIYDDAFLPLARALAAQPAHPCVAHLNLNDNDLSYDGFEMMWEVMAYNHALTTVKLDGNCVRVPTDTWEGFNIQEQCRVNREMLKLGLYTVPTHHKWPPLFRRKLAKLWYVWRNFEFHGDIDMGLWECVLQFVDGRGYVNRKVRLWMKHQR
eukprot:TRINITY_DN25264_c0_g1_i1.p1 TRINITY_DN25264_c0_g1~~TRINITY_DN25264_c0_g1_i1.p1  ORF type:complete len:394 (+),score=143.53 TRINITY_DN25264_c0_g1_i1:91-1272(+)